MLDAYVVRPPRLQQVWGDGFIVLHVAGRLR